MSRLKGLRAWLRDVFGRGAAEARMDEEMRFHVEMETRKHVRAGVDPAESRRRALRSFGGVDVHKEAMRDRRRLPVLERVVTDLLYAWRSLRHAPGFTVVAVVTLALGIGATTAIFSVLNGVVLRPLPFPDDTRLVRIWAGHPARGLPFFSVSPPDYEDWRATATRFEALGAFDRGRSVMLDGAGAPTEVLASDVAPQVFDVLGVRPVAGRALTGGDIAEGQRVVVLGYGFWQRHFGGDAGALGGTLTLDGIDHQVVGVMPAGFTVPGTPAELWLPLDLRGASERSARYLRVLGRVEAGTAVDAAIAELEAISARLAAQYPDTNAGWSVTVVPLRDVIVGEGVRRALLVLLGVVALVLLIACANVANLLLTRATTRTRELAVRAALGAGRARMFGHALAESVVLCALAGAAGVALAAVGLAALRSLQPAGLPRLDEIALDGRALAFTAAVSFVTAVGFGLLPAFRARGALLGEALRESGRVSPARPTMRARAVLVVIQTALALLLMIGAGLMTRSLARVASVEPGFEPEGLVAFELNLPESRYPSPELALAFFEGARERADRLPGAEGAALISSIPFGGPNRGELFVPEGLELAPGERPPDADLRVVSSSYFETLRIPVLAGRSLPEGAAATGAMVISQTMARRFWPDGSPIGRRVRIGGSGTGPEFTIVGVVGDVRYQSLEAPEVRPMMYVSHRWQTPRSLTLVVRAREPDRLAAGIRAIQAELDPDQPLATARLAADVVNDALGERRFNALLFGLFAVLAAVLASIGIYGVLSYAVALRTREIGIRITFGASRPTLVRRFVGQAAAQVGLGIAIGIALALALTRVMTTLLYETSPTEPLTFAAMAGLLLAVALLATWLPVRRAARVDPVVALRHE